MDDFNLLINKQEVKSRLSKEPEFKQIINNDIIYYKVKKIDQDNFPPYLIDVKNIFNYIGYIDEDLNRTLLGYNFYKNNDIYLGKWQENKKQGQGLYIYNSDKNINKLYFGDWDKGEIGSKGMILTEVEYIDSSEYKLIKGNIENSEFKNGTSINIDPNKRIEIFLGDFVDGKMDSENGFMIDNFERCLAGKFKKGSFVNGTIINLININGQIMCDRVFKFKLNYDEKENEDPGRCVNGDLEKMEIDKNSLVGLSSRINYLYNKKFYKVIKNLCGIFEVNKVKNQFGNYDYWSDGQIFKNINDLFTQFSSMLNFE